MAEFSRKSGRRILENIDTKKSSKLEVFEFYKRQHKQLKSKGGQVGKILDMKSVKKSDIEKELERLEQVQEAVRAKQQEKQLEKYTQKYEQTKKEMEKMAVRDSVKEYKRFQKSLKAAATRGDINLESFLGGAFKDIAKKKKKKVKKEVVQPEIPKKKPSGSLSPKGKLKKASSTFRGRLAHDLVSKWVDDMLIDPDSFEDSDTIFAAMETVDENPTDYQFFKDYYAGDEKEGSQAYYEEFQGFLDIMPIFENDLAANDEEIPPYPSFDYWQRLQDWRRSL